jgi:hypothetical protein
MEHDLQCDTASAAIELEMHCQHSFGTKEAFRPA